MEKLIITAALTGAEVTREHQPHLPITPEEIAEEAYKCWQAGASIVHVHARNADGSPTQAYEMYKEIKELVEAKCDVIFQPSTGGAVWHSPEERLQPVELAPEMATLSMGTCNFGPDVFMNSEEYIEKFAKKNAGTWRKARAGNLRTWHDPKRNVTSKERSCSSSNSL